MLMNIMVASDVLFGTKKHGNGKIDELESWRGMLSL